MNKKLMIVMMVVGMSALYVRFQVMGMERGGLEERRERMRRAAEGRRDRATGAGEVERAAEVPAGLEKDTEGFYGFLRPKNEADEEATKKALELNMGHGNFPAEMREAVRLRLRFPPKVMAFLCHKLCIPNRVQTLQCRGPVYSMAFSPDGKLLATGSYDRTAVVWDVVSGNRVKTLQYSGSVTTVAFSPDRNLLATGSTEDGIKIWNVTSWDSKRLQSTDRDVAVAFSPDGKLLADSELSIWDVASGQIVQRLNYNFSANSIAFSPDGRLLATGSSYDRTAGIWDVASGQRIHTLQHADRVNSVAFSPDGRLLATGSSDRTADIWDVASGDRKHTLQCGNLVFSVAFSPNGELLATGSLDDTGGIWNVRSGQRLQTLQCGGSVYSVAFSPNGKVLATAGKSVSLWNVECLQTLERSTITTVAQYQLMRAFEETFDYERNEAGEYVYDPQGRKILIRIHPTLEQWSTFLTLPQEVQNALRVRIKNPNAGPAAGASTVGGAAETEMHDVD